MGMTKFRAPTLPNPPLEWDTTYGRQLIRVLEIYFSQLDSKTPRIAESYTADEFYGSVVNTTTQYGSFYSTSTQTAANTVAGFTITFDGTALSSGVTLANTSELHVTTDGVYQVGCTLDAENSTAHTQTLQVWVAKNGTAVPSSNNNFGMVRSTGGGGNGHTCVQYSTLLQLAASDYIEFKWKTSDTGVTLHHDAASSPVPETYSVRACINLVSAV